MKTIQLRGGKELVIRRVQPDDAAAMMAYLEQISGETDYITFGPGELPMTLDEERRYIESLEMRSNAIMFVAILDQEIVGNLHFNGGGRPRIQHAGEFGISVLKKAWEMGIGSALIEEMLSWAKSTDLIRKINLQVRTDNDNAIALYEKHGFVSEGTLTKAMYVKGVYYNNYMMGLEIKS